jgi:hypothetical protein
VQSRSVLEFRSAETDATIRGEPILLGGEKYEVVSPAPDLDPGKPSSYTVGTVYITIGDPKINTVLWRGMAESVLREQASDEQRRQRLEQAMHKVMEKFPPATKK